MFLNLENGLIRVLSYRLQKATATTRDDLIIAFENKSKETLTAIAEDGDDHYDGHSQHSYE